MHKISQGGVLTVFRSTAVEGEANPYVLTLEEPTTAFAFLPCLTKFDLNLLNCRLNLHKSAACGNIRIDDLGHNLEHIPEVVSAIHNGV